MFKKKELYSGKPLSSEVLYSLAPDYEISYIFYLGLFFSQTVFLGSYLVAEPVTHDIPLQTEFPQHGLGQPFTSEIDLTTPLLYLILCTKILALPTQVLYDGQPIPKTLPCPPNTSYFYKTACIENYTQVYLFVHKS